MSSCYLVDLLFFSDLLYECTQSPAPKNASLLLPKSALVPFALERLAVIPRLPCRHGQPKHSRGWATPSRVAVHFLIASYVIFLCCPSRTMLPFPPLTLMVGLMVSMIFAGLQFEPGGRLEATLSEFGANPNNGGSHG